MEIQSTTQNITQNTTQNNSTAAAAEAGSANPAKNAIQEREKAQMGTVSEKDYTAVSKDGDTLELSEGSANKTSQKVKIAETDENNPASRMTDAALAKCSKSKLKQLLSTGKISKQQYEKAMKKQ